MPKLPQNTNLVRDDMTGYYGTQYARGASYGAGYAE